MSLTKKYNLLYFLLLQFLERFSYFNILIQLPIYISQKGIENGLGLGQEIKGWIFFIWALVQNVTPIFVGVIADKISQERTIFISILFVCIGYLAFSQSQSIVFIFSSVMLIGFGCGGFKPSLQGLLSKSQNKNVWSIYLVINNLAFLLALFFSNYLKKFGWNFVFWGSFIISFLNLLLSYFIFKTHKKEKPPLYTPTASSIINFSEINKILVQKRIIYILGFTTCFAIIYMQFYETLPNFIVDWIDTSSLVQLFGLPKDFTMLTSFGEGISYEFIFIINPIIVITFAQIVQNIFSTKDPINSLLISLALVTIGFASCGFSANGLYLISGMIIYTFGEILFNIKILELVSQIAPTKRKSTYLGLLNISYTFGLTLGAVSSGYLYKEFAEKYTLATKYLENHTNLGTNFKSVENFFISKESTILLWNHFKPYFFWIPYILIGFLGIIVIYIFKKYNNKLIVNTQGKK